MLRLVGVQKIWCVLPASGRLSSCLFVSHALGATVTTEVAVVNYGPFSASLILPIPEQCDLRYWTRWAIAVAIGLVVVWKVFVKCCSGNRRAQERWAALCLRTCAKISQQEREAVHDSAVAEGWAEWNRLGRDLKANRAGVAGVERPRQPHPKTPVAPPPAGSKSATATCDSSDRDLSAVSETANLVPVAAAMK